MWLSDWIPPDNNMAGRLQRISSSGQSQNYSVFSFDKVLLNEYVPGLSSV